MDSPRHGLASESTAGQQTFPRDALTTKTNITEQLTIQPTFTCNSTTGVSHELRFTTWKVAADWHIDLIYKYVYVSMLHNVRLSSVKQHQHNEFIVFRQ